MSELNHQFKQIIFQINLSDEVPFYHNPGLMLYDHVSRQSARCYVSMILLKCTTPHTSSRDNDMVIIVECKILDNIKFNFRINQIFSKEEILFFLAA